jgi:hypothetical protein
MRYKNEKFDDLVAGKQTDKKSEELRLMELIFMQK